MNKTFKLLLAAMLISAASFAQTSVKKELPPHGWHLLDPATTGYNGISLDKAYAFLKTQQPRSKTVLVAVIDSGIDTAHEDLKPILWTNTKEIPGNGIDDDNNGYIDDIHGWNFLGGKDGRNVEKDSYEAARVYYKLKSKWENYDGKKVLNAIEKAEFDTYERAKEETVGSVNPLETMSVKSQLPKLKEGDEVLKKLLKKDSYTGKDLKTFETEDKAAMAMKAYLLNISKANDNYDITNDQLIGYMQGKLDAAMAAEKPPVNYRGDIVGDDETNINDTKYGNNDLMGEGSFHGTHCSGIIGAVRENGVGIDGVADNVRIMVLRAVPDGDEHDKDIALAIRYAVDNGAQIISMSFGKSFSPEKMWVDDAFKYAASKNVLLVHAAGNSAENLDVSYNYPNAEFADGTGRASNLITVGASGDMKNGGLTASFSNYGKKEVDVFAPGVGIYSTVPGGDQYGNANGTSMACPVVAGVAALIMEHYPNLSAVQVKEIIEKSATVSTEKVNTPGTKDKVLLSDISRTGGFLNAYAAVQMAHEMSMKDDKKPMQKNKLPKAKVKRINKG